MADQYDPFLFVTEEARSVSFQPTTMAYARMLLAPYQQALMQSDNPQALKAWMTQAFPESIQMELTEEIDAKEGDKGEPLTGPEIRNDILEHMASGLLGAIDDHHIASETDVAVLPWDIAPSIYDEWAPLFGIDKTKTVLPVTVTIGPQQFTHNLTLEQALGLLLFSRVSGSNFQPVMFGVPLTYFEDPEEHSRFDVSDTPTHFPCYRVNVNGDVYQFKSPDFMHGIATGAMWAGVDHHAYWSDLQQWTAPDAQPIPLNF
jgi:hypothetical protein